MIPTKTESLVRAGYGGDLLAFLIDEALGFLRQNI